MKEKISKNFEGLYKDINEEEKALSNLLLLSMDTKATNALQQHKQLMTIIKEKFKDYHFEGYVKGSVNSLKGR